MLQICILFILIGMSSYFSATETAFSSMNKIRLKNMDNNGNKNAKLVLTLSENYEKLLSAILIGNNIVNILSSSIAALLFVEWFGNAGVTISTIVMTILVLIFGEITPKSIAKNYPESFAMFSAPIMKFFMTILTPVNFIFVSWTKLISKVFKSSNDRGITEEELLTIIDEAQNDGDIDSNEGELIRNAIEFNDIEVIDIHTNRVDVVAIDENTSKQKIKEVFKKSGFSRLPVYSGSIDNIIGILNQKDFYNEIDKDFNIKSIITKPVFIIPSMKVSELLSLLQKSKSHLAVIIDEYGGTVGIITLEDILEELVGEIWDEHDNVIEEFQKINENEYKILCSANLDDFLEKFDIKYETDITTVGGWVIEKLGKIPIKGDSFEFENLRVIVEKCDSRHVLEITVKILSKIEI